MLLLSYNVKIKFSSSLAAFRYFDENSSSKTRLKGVLEKVCSFPTKPDFVVITGDLVHWGGLDSTGAMNYEALIECFYKKNNMFYADPECKVPIYLTPGNHDYMWENSLFQYHKHINPNNKYIVRHKDMTLKVALIICDKIFVKPVIMRIKIIKEDSDLFYTLIP